MKLFGIPIKVEASFLAVVVFLALSRSSSIALIIEWLVVVFVSILLHEFGHAFAARAFGLSPSIRLYQMGGQTSWQSGVALTPVRHLVISLSGPAVGFLLGGCVFLVGPALLRTFPSPVSAVAYRDLLWVNIGWGLFNLLPMLPLDGGRVLTTLEEWLLHRKDQLVSHAFSFVVALAIAFLAISGRSVWIAFLGIYFAYLNWSFLWAKWQTSRDRKLEPLLAQIGRAIEEDQPDLALPLIARVQKRARSHRSKSEAARLLVFLHIKQNNREAAEIALHRYNTIFGGDPYLQGVFHFCREEMLAAIPHLKAAFESCPDAKLGLILGKALLDTKELTAVVELCEHPVMEKVAWQLYANVQNEAFAAEQFKLSAQAGARWYAHEYNPNVAYNVACALARSSEPSEALEWLRVAVAAGFADRQALLSDSDLEAIRSLPEFSTILETFDL